MRHAFEIDVPLKLFLPSTQLTLSVFSKKLNSFNNTTMCFRNGIEYGCPMYHIQLNTRETFNLCALAQHYPIQHQCANIVDRHEKTDVWCPDCLGRRQKGLPVDGEKVQDDRRASRLDWKELLRHMGGNIRGRDGPPAPGFLRTIAFHDD